MSKPTARIGDMHLCPAVTSKVPHVGGPVLSAQTSVWIGGERASRLGDNAVCIGPIDTISSGSSSVLIEGKPAARTGDTCEHGGYIQGGCSSVLIG